LFKPGRQLSAPGNTGDRRKIKSGTESNKPRCVSSRRAPRL